MSSNQLVFDLHETSQAKELLRVSDRLRDAIYLFFDSHQVGEEFYAENLRKFVSDRVQVAPGSADRVMRDMRKRGLINYSVVSRSKSLYVKESVA